MFGAGRNSLKVNYGYCQDYNCPVFCQNVMLYSGGWKNIGLGAVTGGQSEDRSLQRLLR